MPYADAGRQQAARIAWRKSVDEDGLTPRMREVLAVLTNIWQTTSVIELKVAGQRPTNSLFALRDRGLVEHLWKFDCWRVAQNTESRSE